MKEIQIRSSADGSMQGSMYQKATVDGKRPLAVALHTWSHDHTVHYEHYERLCNALGFDLIFPCFRGFDNTPQACGSTLVLADLADARNYAVENSDVDPDRIYLIGGSGGGHAALLAAGRMPELWSAVSAWCPISDIAAWHRQCLGTPFARYARHIELACGGDPETDVHARLEAANRSPLTWLSGARGHILDINTGIHDGHIGSVPVSQAVNAYNVLAAPADRISETDIRFMVEHEAIPETLRWNGCDPAYGANRVLLRKISGTVRLTIFEGGHDILADAGFAFLSACRAGTPPDWSPCRPLTGGTKIELTQ